MWIVYLWRAYPCLINAVRMWDIMRCMSIACAQVRAQEMLFASQRVEEFRDRKVKGNKKLLNHLKVTRGKFQPLVGHVRLVCNFRSFIWWPQILQHQTEPKTLTSIITTEILRCLAWKLCLTCLRSWFCADFGRFTAWRITSWCRIRWNYHCFMLVTLSETVITMPLFVLLSAMEIQNE